MKPTDPTERLGVYKDLGEVPDRYRLQAFEGIYSGRDPWDEFVQETGVNDMTDRRIRQYNRAKSRWEETLEPDRHYALGRPMDVEMWANALTDRFSLWTAHRDWTLIEKLYRWLAWHTDHPHRYNVFLMAASEYPHSNQIWGYKMKKRSHK